MQPALTAAVRLGLVTIVPVPRIPSEARYGATVVSSRATLVLLKTQLSAAVSSVRENNNVTNGPGGPATAGIAVAATTGSANIRTATAAPGHRRARTASSVAATIFLILAAPPLPADDGYMTLRMLGRCTQRHHQSAQPGASAQECMRR